MILFFDTETTGLVQWRLPIDDPLQPHLVQLAAQLTEDDGTPVASISLVVNPGVEIPIEASNVHGITTERAQAVGTSKKLALHTLAHLHELADLVVAHNISFDAKMIDVELRRVGVRGFEQMNKPTFCTMRAATPVCRVMHANPRGPNDFKWPKLSEAVRHFFDEELEGAHDALVDVTACRRVYFALQGVGRG